MLERDQDNSELTCPGGNGWRFFFVFVLPRHALITVLCLWRWISASSWFHNLSCSAPFMSLPNSWICCILNDGKQIINMYLQGVQWDTDSGSTKIWLDWSYQKQIYQNIISKKLALNYSELIACIIWMTPSQRGPLAQNGVSRPS